MHILLSALDMIEKRSVSSHSNSVKALEQQLKKWKSFSLMETFDSLLDESQKSTLMIEFLEKNESHLLEEIDRVAGIYGKLEEQQNKKVFDLTQKRDQALKLQAEVTD
jgi:E3 ubiquitin-protein ligase BRE1